VRYWIDRKIHWGTRVISRCETGHGALKRDLNNSSGDIKEVINKFQLLLSRIFNEALTKWDQERRITLQKHDIELFSFIRKYMTNYAFDLILQRFNRVKNPKVIEDFNTLELCTRYFRHTYGLSCAYEIQRRFGRGDRPFIIDDIDRH